jgi:hypothetical protein
VPLAAHRHHIVVINSSSSPSHRRRPIVVVVLDNVNVDVVEYDVVVVVTAVVFHLPIVVVAIAAIIVVGIVVFAVAVTIDIVAHRRRACRASWLSKPRRYRPWHGDGAPPLGFAVGLPTALLGRHLVKDVVLSKISWC